ncbi:unnamed protein product [Dicrocoelium dendriticum]|nr:unnamed protein product [Dicrocoelium dendriticum]
MSWLSGLVSKAENFLNNIDSSAADALGPLRTNGLKMDLRDSDYEAIDSPHELSYRTATHRSGTPNIPSHLHEGEEPKHSASWSISRDEFVKREPDSHTLGPWEWDAYSHETITMRNGDVIPRIAADTSTSDVRAASVSVTLASLSSTSPSTTHVQATDPRKQNDDLRLGIGDSHTNIVDSTTPGHIDLTPTVQSHTNSDVHLENRLLRSEMSSLSQEVSDLLRRNIKTTEENKELHSQIGRLRHQLHDSDRRIGELQGTIETLQPAAASTEVTSSYEAADLKHQLAAVKSELEVALSSSKKFEVHVDMLNSQLQESRRCQELTEKRLQVSLDQTARVTQELSQYKEKATHILAMKDKLIASLREATSTNTQHHSLDGSADECTDALRHQLHLLRTEYDVFREEAARWRYEADQRDLVVQEMETQLQAERESSRHSLESAEQQAHREKQVPRIDTFNMLDTTGVILCFPADFWASNRRDPDLAFAVCSHCPIFLSWIAPWQALLTEQVILLQMPL